MSSLRGMRVKSFITAADSCRVVSATGQDLKHSERNLIRTRGVKVDDGAQSRHTNTVMPGCKVLHQAPVGHHTQGQALNRRSTWAFLSLQPCSPPGSSHCRCRAGLNSFPASRYWAQNIWNWDYHHCMPLLYVMKAYSTNGSPFHLPSKTNEVCHRREETLPRTQFHYRRFWGRSKKVLCPAENAQECSPGWMQLFTLSVLRFHPCLRTTTTLKLPFPRWEWGLALGVRESRTSAGGREARRGRL